MAKLSIYVLEDRPLLAEGLADTLQKLGYQAAGLAYTGEKALQDFAREQPDLAILDIELGEGISGIEVGRQIREQYGFPFIYLTGLETEEVLLQARSTKPAAYLTKPTSPISLKAAIEIAVENHGMQRSPEPGVEAEAQEEVVGYSGALFIRSNRSYEKVKLEDILWVEAKESYSRVVCRDQEFLLTYRLKLVQERLPQQIFRRVHRSYLVNLENVEAISDQGLRIGEQYIPVSQSNRSEINRYFDFL